MLKESVGAVGVTGAKGGKHVQQQMAIIRRSAAQAAVYADTPGNVAACVIPRDGDISMLVDRRGWHDLKGAGRIVANSLRGTPVVPAVGRARKDNA